MSFDPWKPDFGAAQVKPEGLVEPQPDDADIVKALVEIEHATHRPAAVSPSSGNDQPEDRANQALVPEPSLVAKLLLAQRPKILIVYVSLIFLALTLMRLESFKRERSPGSIQSTATKQVVDQAAQNEVESLLARVAAGDREAASDLLERAPSWTGTIQRTASTSRSLGVAMNLPDLKQREAALAAALALDGISKGEASIQRLESQLSTPVGRAWALWILGALGHRGVDPEHIAKIIGAYIDDPDANTRAAAVNGLAVLGTDETIPMLLDRFRNDPSPVVEERAACGLAESGMYTHEQRMIAAATLVGWLDDSLLSAEQHRWTIQALADIAHQNFGNDSAAWRSWYESARGSTS